MDAPSEFFDRDEPEAVVEEVPYTEDTVALSSLKPHPRNYQAHPEDQLEQIVASIKRYGFYRKVLVAKDMTILAGHGGVTAAIRAGLEMIPVRVYDLDPGSPQALKLLIGDNESARLAERDDRLLTELAKEVVEGGEDLIGSGYDEMMLANLVFVTRARGEIDDFDAAVEWVGMPEYDDHGPDLRVVMHFANVEDRKAFLAKLEIPEDTLPVGVRIPYAWWPPRERADRQSLKFETKG